MRERIQIRIGDELRDADWKSFFEAWCAVMDRYTELFDGHDLAYWWDERPNTSYLAGAAWKLGGAAIEEFGVDRHSGTKTSKGRCDLWIKVPQLKLECEIEAKMIWGRTFDTTLRNVTKRINEASKQLQSPYTDPDRMAERASVGIALCFICPEVRSPKEGEDMLKELYNHFGNCTEKNKYLVAVYTPPQGTEIVDAHKYYPGVALIGKMVWNTRT